MDTGYFVVWTHVDNDYDRNNMFFTYIVDIIKLKTEILFLLITEISRGNLLTKLDEIGL